MLPKDRVIATLDHRAPDRIPVGEIGIDYPITERVLGRETFYRARWKEFQACWEGRRDEVVESYKRDIVDLACHLDLDLVSVPLVPSRKRASAPEFLGPKRWRTESGQVWAFSPESEGLAVCVEFPPLEAKDIPAPSIELPVDESELEVVAHVAQELRGTHFIVGRCGDGSFPWEETVGMEEYLLRMRTDPEFVDRATAWATAKRIAIAQAMLDLGCDAVLLDADYCGNCGPLMSPADFRRFCLPSLHEQCEAVKRRGGYPIKHSDGYTLPVLEDMIGAGIVAWQGIQPRLGMDMQLLKERVGDRLCLWGGVNCETLTSGGPEDVRAEVAYAIRYASRDGGLILGTGNTVMVGIPWENYHSMLDAVREWGTYPIEYQRLACYGRIQNSE